MRLVRYFFVGSAAALVDIGLFAVFARLLGYNYLIVAACTFVVATGVHYGLSVRRVFESRVRFSRPYEIALVFAVSAIGLGINQGVLFADVSIGSKLIICSILATGILFSWTYFARADFFF